MGGAFPNFFLENANKCEVQSRDLAPLTPLVAKILRLDRLLITLVHLDVGYTLGITWPIKVNLYFEFWRKPFLKFIDSIKMSIENLMANVRLFIYCR